MTEPMKIRVKLPLIADIANELIAEHVGDGWRFAWDNAKVRAGACHYGTKTISLSKPIFSGLATIDEAREVILHEIAHAIAGRGTNHGPEWKAVARSLGIPGDRCHDLDTPEAPWTGGPCGCDRTYKRHKIPRNNTLICNGCGWRLGWVHAVTGERRGTNRPDDEPESETGLPVFDRLMSDTFGGR